ncbi:MAG TPA: orotate phosphoribosyltransferase [Firmicutes bacterium]|nr:orotate phosphoribosyltransferase [Bacillota bacterium]
MTEINVKEAERAMELFRQAGALLKGHFLLTSGRHSDTYLEKSLVLQYPRFVDELSAMLAEKFAADKIEVVVGPAVGAIVLAHGVARVLGTRAIFTEREGGRCVLRRGFSLAPGERTLVVEDVVTTGGSVREVIDLVRATGADLVGVGCLLDRSGGRTDLGVRTAFLAQIEAPSWLPADCPLCAAGVPLTSRGSRHI